MKLTIHPHLTERFKINGFLLRAFCALQAMVFHLIRLLTGHIVT
jgi:hypothetical protein